VTLASLGSAVLRLAESMRQVALIPSVTDVRLTSSITPRDEGADVVAEISATLSSHGPFAAYFEVSFEGGEATAHAVIDVIEQQGFLWEARPRHAQSIEELTILVEETARERCGELERRIASVARSA